MFGYRTCPADGAMHPRRWDSTSKTIAAPLERIAALIG
jgi:hypothetical protein